MTKVELPPDREFWIPCTRCGRRTCHRAITAAADTDETPDGATRCWDDYFVLECQGCKTVSFSHQSRQTDNVEYDHYTGEEQLVVTEKLYPPRVVGLREFDRVYLLPANIRAIYRETVTAVNGDLPIISGIGIRAIVETVCKHEKARGRNLEKKIDNLREKGIVTAAAAEVLHGLRFMGNAAAHEVKAHSQEELAIALEVLENLLKGVYVIPKRARKLIQAKPGTP